MVSRRILLSITLLSLVISARVLASALSYTPRYHTIAHEILGIEAGALPVDDSMYQLLDDILDDVKNSVGSRPTPSDKAGVEKVLRTIDGILIRRNFVLYGDGPACAPMYLRDALVPETLEPSVVQDIVGARKNRRRKPMIDVKLPIHEVDCDTASFIYLAVGDAFNLPISAVMAPEHVFVRWEFKDGSYLNWETTKGASVGDDTYMRAMHISQDSCDRGVYLQSLTREEVLGYCYSLRGDKLAEKKEYSAASEDYERSMQLYGKSFWGYDSFAWILATTEDPKVRDGKKAVRLAKKAVEIDRSAMNLDTLAAAYAETGDFRKAVECDGEAHRLDPCEPAYAFFCDVYSQNKTYVQYAKEAEARGEKAPILYGDCPYRKAVKQ